MTLCFLIKDLRINGANRVLLKYINALIELNYTLKCYVEQPITSFESFKTKFELVDIKYFDPNGCEVIVSTFYSNHKYLSAATNAIKIQFIQDNYFRYGSKTDQRLKMISDCLFDLKTHKIVVSRFLKDMYEALGVNTTLVTNGVDKNVFCRDDGFKSLKKGKVVLIEGLVDRDYLRVKEAYSLVPSEFEICGLSTKPHNLMGNSQMFVNPKQSDLKKIYSAAEFLLELEQDEGFNLTILEAMACGCIVITTRSGGHMDYCVHLNNSVILQDLSEVSHYLNHLIENPDLYHEISKNAKKIVDKYSWQVSINAFERFIKTLRVS